MQKHKAKKHTLASSKGTNENGQRHRNSKGYNRQRQPRRKRLATRQPHEILQRSVSITKQKKVERKWQPVKTKCVNGKESKQQP